MQKLHKFLLDTGDLTDWTAGDLCEDDRINGLDLAILKKMLLS